MKIERRSIGKWHVVLAVFVAVFLFVFLTAKFKGSKNVEAANLANFDPGYIISDYQMSNYNSMSEAEIQNFLREEGNCGDTRTYLASYYPNLSYHIKDGHFVCLADETFGDGVAYGDGVANDAVQQEQDGVRDEVPEAPAHGVDVLLLVQLLDLLAVLLLVALVLLLQRLDLGVQAGHLHGALLAASRLCIVFGFFLCL